ncbi:hypothetical protein PF008_g3615 [Phytophthora fragariae]|uniref:Uncharacterized protein n=1 Tax=Phytophthora fragariae TaxID=53985 RepID=A0A6G0SDQ7_9STRA|nr:hypothetical protein PF008_g3615 [Phytophthora fragariae]
MQCLVSRVGLLVARFFKVFLVGWLSWSLQAAPTDLHSCSCTSASPARCPCFYISSD